MIYCNITAPTNVRDRHHHHHHYIIRHGPPGKGINASSGGGLVDEAASSSTSALSNAPTVRFPAPEIISEKFGMTIWSSVRGQMASEGIWDFTFKRLSIGHGGVINQMAMGQQIARGLVWMGLKMGALDR